MERVAGLGVIVAGGASGIGEATAMRFASLGADVAILDWSEEGGRRVAEGIRAMGRKAFFARTDVRDFDAVKASVGAAIDALGRLDTLVNAVGWNEHAFFVDTSVDFWHKVIDINMWGQIHTTRAVLDTMIAQRRGSIVLIASDAGRVGTNGETIYSVAKGGVIAFSKSLAREVTRFGIRVNCVCPGVTETPMYHATVGHQPEIVQKMVRMIPMRRVAQPKEQAEAIVFLASDASSYITGQTLSVNGGLNML